MLAAVATIGLGLVLGPEAPLLASGSGLALLGSGSFEKTLPTRCWG